jgi:hypothetical protein
MDITGMLKFGEGENTLWLNQLHIVSRPAPAGAGAG